jgi:ABC-2 type transport system permease protein
MLLSSVTIAQREIVRFLRQPSRVVGALAPPVLFWFLIGSGLGDTFRPQAAPDDLTAFGYLFPGTLMLIVMFAAVFSTISIIEDRRAGFLQSVLVAPVPRSAIVMGKLLGGTILAAGQAVLILAAAPFLGMGVTWHGWMLAAVTLTVTAFSFTGLGFLLAWRLDSTQGFHAIMNLFLMPMWLLSGALFPTTGAPVWLRVVMQANPMSHAVDALRFALLEGSTTQAWGIQLPSWSMAFGLCVAFAVLMLLASVWTANRPRIPGLG